MPLQSSRSSLILWLMPLAFVVHDAEEFATWRGWFARNGESLHQWLLKTFGSDPSVALRVMSDDAVLRAMGVMFALLVTVTAAVVLWPGRTTRFIYMAVLGGFFIHGFGHAVQAAAFGGYTPGVVTAVLVVIPASLFIYRHLAKADGVRNGTFVIAAALGAMLVVPAILLALSLGRA